MNLSHSLAFANSNVFKLFLKSLLRTLPIQYYASLHVTGNPKIQKIRLPWRFIITSLLHTHGTHAFGTGEKPVTPYLLFRTCVCASAFHLCSILLCKDGLSWKCLPCLCIASFLMQTKQNRGTCSRTYFWDSSSLWSASRIICSIAEWLSISENKDVKILKIATRKEIKGARTGWPSNILRA